MDESTMIFDSVASVNELNKVAGFDPRKLMSRRILENGEQGFYLDLKYRKLWFRLKHPTGRIKVNTRLINEQRAIFEAKLYLDKDDAEPICSCTAQRYTQGKCGSLYVESAQHAAVSQVLDDAGFGIQFCDVSQGSDREIYGRLVTVSGDGSLKVEQSAACATSPASSAPPGAEESYDRIEYSVAEESPADANEGVSVPNEPAPGENQPLTDTLANAQADTIKPLTEPVAEPTEETASFPIASDTEAAAPTSTYTSDMQVDAIVAVMTVEEAAAVVVETGTCKGWTLAEVAEKRPASLKWYVNGYPGVDNILRAGAKLMLDKSITQKAG